MDAIPLAELAGAEVSAGERFEQLLAEEGAALARVAASYVADAARRDDLFQEICLAIWQALPRFRGESSLRTFVFRIAHNRGLAAVARRRPTGEPLDLAEEVADARPTPELAADQRQRRERLAAAVRELPLALRQALTLALEGLSQREIGEVLGISEGNAAVRLTRARKALKKLLGEEGERSG